jgi:hypothetical protein
MTQRMTGAYVRAQLETILENLAASAEDQQKYLERLGTAPWADELVLELEDFVVMLYATIEDGTLSDKQAAAIREISEFADSFSGETHASLWHVDQLASAWQWSDMRTRARAALAILRGPK